MLARPCRTRNPSIHPRTVGGPAMQAPTSKRQAPHKNTPNLSYYIVGAGLGSARVCRTPPLRFAPHPHRTPPPSPHPQPLNTPPAPLAGLQCRPLQAKGKPAQKHPQPFLLYSRGEHCSPAKALCCRKAPRVEQSPTPTINRKRMREIFIAIL